MIVCTRVLILGILFITLTLNTAYTQEIAIEGIAEYEIQYIRDTDPVLYNALIGSENTSYQLLQNSSADVYYDNRFFLGGFDGEIRTAAIYNDELYVGGLFSSINGNTDVLSIARWDGTDWQPLPISAIGFVYDMMVYDDLLYFSLGTGVYSFDGNTIQQIGGSFNSIAFKLAVLDGNIVAGGFFTTNHSSPGSFNRIARWNGQDWVPFGEGFANGWVESLAEFNDTLYAGGAFTQSGGATVNRIARWNGGEWVQVGSGFDNGVVMDLTVFDNELYAGGSFVQSGGESMDRVAKLVDNEWEQVGDGFNSSVTTLSVIDTALYAGGAFAGSGGATLRKIARLNGEQWQSVGNEISVLESGATNIRAITKLDEKLIIAGGFFSEDLIPRSIAVLESNEWQQFGPYITGGLGVGGGIEDFLIYNNMLIAGGSFTIAGDDIVDRIAMFDGEQWEQIGQGLSSTVNALTVHNGELIAGGGFINPAFRVGKWDGNEWITVGAGFNSIVTSLYSHNGTLYAGGIFTLSGGNTTNRIAQWNGSTWEQIGAGFDNGNVNVIVSYDGDIIAGGTFTQSNGIEVNRVARWDGATWQPMGNGFSSNVIALIVHNGDLYAGGAFLQSGGTQVNYIARWNGESWEPVAGGFNGWVYSLAEYDGILLAGGNFIQSDGQTVSRLAWLQGDSWQPLGSGVSGTVNSLLEYQQALYIGGSFTSAGGIGSSRIARWYDPPRIPDLNYPPDDTTGIDSKIELVWESISRAHNYHLQIALDSNFTQIILDIDTLTTSAFLVENINHSTQLYWRVSALNDVGLSGWSSASTFTTAIAVPVHVSPQMDEEGVSLNPTLSWNSIPDVLHYNLQYSQDENFASAVISYNQLADTSLTITNLPFGTTFYWRVNATTGMGDGEWSPAASFTTVESLPLQVELDGPGMADSLIVDINDVQVLLSWFSGSPHIHYYEVQIAEDADFASLIVSDTTLTDTLYVFTDASDGETYSWRVRAKNAAGWGDFSEVRSFSTTLTSVLTGFKLPEEFILMQNYPNPFNPSTVIRYGIPEQSHVRLEIYNMLGQRVALLVDETLDASFYETTWHANHASGMYFYRLEAVPLNDASNSFVRVNSMILIK